MKLRGLHFDQRKLVLKDFLWEKKRYRIHYQAHSFPVIFSINLNHKLLNSNAAEMVKVQGLIIQSFGKRGRRRGKTPWTSTPAKEHKQELDKWGWSCSCHLVQVQAHPHSPGEQHRTISASMSFQPAAPQAGLSVSGADTGTRWQMGKGHHASCRYKQETCETRVPAPVNFVPVWSSSGCDYLECVRAEERRMGEKLSPCLSHHCCRFPLLIYCLCGWGVQRQVNES